ncbi:MAG: hypothetical protein WCC60_05645, partial [Ilumatobacteraceae bacterium]
PKVTVSQECSAFDGTVSVLLENLGDDVSVTFTVNNVAYVVQPGQTATAVINALGDGAFSIPLSIDGVAQPAITGTIACDPKFNVAAVCNTIDTSDEVSLYWYTITNTEAVPVQVTWNGGSATVPAGGSTQVASTSAPLTLNFNGTQITTAPAAEGVCTRNVVFDKVLVGQPPTGETYTIRVSRLVGAEYTEELTFDLNAGVPKTIALPSTLDPAGISYKVEEINAGTASTSTISPDQLKLSGNLGETISVVVTNGYAAVQINKQSLTTTVLAGGQITYTLQATNTGGLTLDPVVISDRLPSQVSFVSVSVADNGGICALAESTRPQLVVCTMTSALPVGGLTKMITLVVKVDTNVPSGTSILNQAKVLGTYGPVATQSRPESQRTTTEAAATDLSCLPAIAGTVCDLSAKVGVPVSEVNQEAPTTTAVEPDRGQLPATGGSSPVPLLALASGLACFGAALLLSRRRIAS